MGAILSLRPDKDVRPDRVSPDEEATISVLYYRNRDRRDSVALGQGEVHIVAEILDVLLQDLDQLFEAVRGVEDRRPRWGRSWRCSQSPWRRRWRRASPSRR